MEARYKQIRRLFGDKRGARFKVPAYQRGYEWEKKHWRDLWTDLSKIGEQVDQHYLGNIILLEKDSGQSYEIVDGQQRMVTVSLLVLAIRDSPKFERFDDDGELSDVRMKDVLQTNRGDDPIPKLVLADDGAHEQYKLIWNGNYTEANGRVRSAYDYFAGKINTLDEDSLNTLVDDICKFLQVVETVSTDTSLAYNIFQSQNERGKEVSPQILAKARIHGAAADLDDQTGREVTGRWDAIYKQLNRELGGPRFRQDLRIRRPMTQIIINSSVPTSTQIDKSELYRNFEAVLTSYDNVQDFVEWFQSQIDIYLQLSSDNYEISSYQIPDNAIRHLQYLNSASTHSEALSLAIYNSIDEDVLLKENFRLASILAMRMGLSSMSSADTRDAIYQAAREVRQTGDQNDIRQTLRGCVKEHSPTDGEILEYLKANEMNVLGAWNFRTLLTLVSIEEQRRGPFSMDIENLHIEHIAPRKSYEKPEYTEWRDNLDDEKFEQQKNRIGNLTLLTDSDHASVDETSFQSKRRVYADSDVKVAEEVSHKDSWTSEDIDARTESLAKELIGLWSL